MSRRYNVGSDQAARIDDGPAHARAQQRVNAAAALKEYEDTIMHDYDDPGHWEWVATAPESEILIWAQEVGTEDLEEAQKLKVFYRTGPKGSYLELSDGTYADTVAGIGGDIEVLLTIDAEPTDKPMFTSLTAAEIAEYVGM